jgi:hypothetical protein
MEHVPAHVFPQILRKEIISTFGRGPSSLRWMDLPLDAVPPRAIEEDAQLLHHIMRNLADSQVRVYVTRANEIMITSPTGFMHWAVDLVLTDGIK